MRDVVQAVKPDKPTEEQMWAGPSGQRWLANATRFEATLQPIGAALIERAALAPGNKVLDIGCGAGSLCFDIAPHVAPGGTVTGLDISPELIAEASRRAAATPHGVPVRFVQADAARTSLPPGELDVLVSRFGCMFCTDPYAAFSHMHSLLRPGNYGEGGRIALACWTNLQENPWMMEVRAIIARHFDLPTPPPRTPGPFAFGEPDYQRDILSRAGFRQIDISPWKSDMFVGGPGSSPESATGFLLTAVSVAQRAADAPEHLRNQIREELRTRLESFNTPSGVRMPASLWLTTARA